MDHISESFKSSDNRDSHARHAHFHQHGIHVHPTELADKLAYMHHAEHSSTTDNIIHREDPNSQPGLLDEHVHLSGMEHADHGGPIEHVSSMHNMGHVNAFGLSTETDFLFEGINIASVKGIILAMLVTMAIALIYEALNTMLHVREHKLTAKLRKSKATGLQVLELGFSTILKMTINGLAYLLMLCVMTMNIWLFLSVIIGSGLAYLFIRPLLVQKIETATHESLPADVKVTVAETEPLSNNIPDDKEIDRNTAHKVGRAKSKNRVAGANKPLLPM